MDATVLSSSRALGMGWWMALAALALLTVLAGLRVRPLIGGLPARALPVRQEAGQPRYEGKRVEVIDGLFALDCTAWWASNPRSWNWFGLETCLGAVLLYRCRRSLGARILTRGAALLWIVGTLAGLWEFISETSGGHNSAWFRFLLVRTPFSNHPDGFSEPFGLADAYLFVALLLLCADLVRRERPSVA